MGIRSWNSWNAKIYKCIDHLISKGIHHVYTRMNGGTYMQVQVKEWGNSQGIRISKDILQETKITINDVLDVKVVDGVITLSKTFYHKTVRQHIVGGVNSTLV